MRYGDIEAVGRLLNPGNDDVRVIELETEGANAGAARIFVGTQDPSGNVSGNPGDFYFRVASGLVSAPFIHNGPSAGSAGWSRLLAYDIDEVIQTSDGTVTPFPSGYTVQGDPVGIVMALVIQGHDNFGNMVARFRVDASFRMESGTVTEEDVTIIGGYNPDGYGLPSFVIAATLVTPRVTGKAGTTIDWRVSGFVTENAAAAPPPP